MDSQPKSLWAIFYLGKITLPVFLTKSEAVEELRKRPDHYYTKKQDYKLVRYAEQRPLHREAKP